MTSELQPYERELREINAYSEQIQQDARSQMPSIPARCHDILAPDGQREARLVVLLDSRGRAIEADLYYNSSLPGVTQNRVQRLAKNLLAAGYAGSGPNIPVYAYDLGPQLGSDAVFARNGDGGQGSVSLPAVVGGIVALFFVIGLLAAMLSVLFRSRQEAAAPTATPPALVGTFNAGEGGASTEPTATLDPAALIVQTNNLPASRNANPSIGVNQTVRIRGEFKSYVRSQPGPDQGTEVGFLQGGETATVLGGPVLLPGDSDTIVWWYVQLNNGTRGWTPANTSTLTLLEPAQ